MSKGLRFEKLGRTNDVPNGDFVYAVRYPAYVRSQPCKALVADNLKGWTRKYIEAHPVKGWDDIRNGVDMMECNKGKYLKFYVPPTMAEEEMNGLSAYVNSRFFKRWD